MAGDVADRVRNVDVDLDWDYGETKPAFKTTELIVLVAVAVAVLIASAIADDIDARLAWILVTVLASSYVLSRGIAKAGSETRTRRGSRR